MLSHKVIFQCYYQYFLYKIAFCIQLIWLILLSKLAHFFMMSTDYVCTPRDISVIESIMSAPRKPCSWTLEMPCYQPTIWNAF